jgi:hypothetical protein
MRLEVPATICSCALTKTTHPSDKLDFCCLRPFEILDKCGKLSYLLKLLSTLSQLHPVFHVPLLECFVDPSIIPDHLLNSIKPYVQIIIDNHHDISTILDSKKIGQ